MTKTNSRFKEAYNQVLILIEKRGLAAQLPGESTLAQHLNVSRTIIRSVLSSLQTAHIILWQGRHKEIIRLPEPGDYFTDEETTSHAARLQQDFLEWILVGDILPNTPLNELEMARQFKVSTSTVREFLIDFSRFGLIERSANHKWVLQGFTEEYALELCDVRVLFEMQAVTHFTKLEKDHPVWQELQILESDHMTLLDNIEVEYHRFSILDERFHTLINHLSGNRFMADFQDLISLIFHYHYQWNKQDEKQRNKQAIMEHLHYINALKSQDINIIKHAAQAHLKSARDTLIRSLKN